MRLPMTLLLIAALAGSAAAQAKPKPVISLPFADKWVVNYDDNSCHLLAQFGDAKDGIAMKLTRFAPSDFFDLTLFGTPLRVSGRMVDVTLDFGLAGKPIEREALVGSTGELPLLIASGLRIDGRYTDENGTPPPVTPQQEATASALTIGFKGKSYRLETGKLDRPLAALRLCQTDLLKTWGYDPEVQATLTREPRPVGNPGSWARFDDYPMAALLKGRSGLVKFRLDVDETGAVKGCTVLERTNPIEFAKTTCAILLKRGRFEPALDKDGKPVRSFWVSSVRWMI